MILEKNSPQRSTSYPCKSVAVCISFVFFRVFRGISILSLWQIYIFFDDMCEEYDLSLEYK